MNDRYAQEAYRNAERLRQSAAQTAESNTQIQKEIQELKAQHAEELTRIQAELQEQSRASEKRDDINLAISLLTLVSTVSIGILGLIH